MISIVQELMKTQRELRELKNNYIPVVSSRKIPSNPFLLFSLN
jgi:hypothetical protein